MKNVQLYNNSLDTQIGVVSVYIFNQSLEISAIDQNRNRLQQEKNDFEISICTQLHEIDDLKRIIEVEKCKLMENPNKDPNKSFLNISLTQTTNCTNDSINVTPVKSASYLTYNETPGSVKFLKLKQKGKVSKFENNKSRAKSPLNPSSNLEIKYKGNEKCGFIIVIVSILVPIIYCFYVYLFY